MRVEKFSAPHFFVLLCVSLAGWRVAWRPEPTTTRTQQRPGLGGVFALQHRTHSAGEHGFRVHAHGSGSTERAHGGCLSLSNVVMFFISKIVYEFSTWRTLGVEFVK